MTTLYSISDEYRSILESLEDGELTDAMRERLDSVEHNLTKKATNVAAHIRNMEEMALAIKDAESRMRKRRKAMEARVEWFRQYLLENMENTGIGEIECPWFRIGIRKNPIKVAVTDIHSLPYDTVAMTVKLTKKEYRRILDEMNSLNADVISLIADKKELKCRLERGEEINGAELTQSKRVHIF